ncbi:MAG TPA: 3-oxoacyl-[acyl-carrier-protein] synthase III C-terminal domain-containing protein [Candidatus Binataceae bacterium]|jgi:alkylresorcinol/alkylpyrone synthase|nr:3-oxoacyl-[acyl-carrier-protein] synthase III C-terminal domain-containing protein [Candidatus Binataceae bacterium]
MSSEHLPEYPATSADRHAPQVRAVGLALPPNYVEQQVLTDALRDYWTRKYGNARRLDDFHRAVRVRGRHLALPITEYPPLDTFAKTNQAWNTAAVEVGEAAVRSALDRSGLEPADVDHFFFVTVTGISTPSVDARIINRTGMRPGVKRTPIFGLGCVAGAAGLARASDYVRAFPDHVALLLSVELCSLTLQRDDLSLANLIASGLFGDGAAAVVVAGARRAMAQGPRVIATRSALYPGTERVMGWDVVDSGFKVILSPRVPEVIEQNLGGDVNGFLAEHGLDRGAIRHWIAHTGGPRVLQAIESALGLPCDALERSWRSLHEIGNLSSASVLFVLADLLAAQQAKPGEYGMLMAMGPGFCSELVLLRW